MNEEKDRSTRVAEELEKMSPLALPQYLMECEFYDQQEAQEILDEVVEEFEDGGGVAGNMANSVLVSVANSTILVLSEKFHEPTYKKLVKRKINVSSILDRCVNFQYPDDAPQHQGAQQTFVHDQLRRDASGINKEYNTDNYRDKQVVSGEHPEGNRNKQFRDSQFQGKETIRDATGRLVYNKGNAPLSPNGKERRDKVGEADHVKPLKMIHEEQGAFIRRYVDEDSIKEIVNEDENFQLLAGNINASKGGGKTNEQFILYNEEIDSSSAIYAKPESDRTSAENEALGKLTPTQRKAARLKAKGDDLTDEERQILDKYELDDEAKNQLRINQKKGEENMRSDLLKTGTATVIVEQIGQIVETITGPIAFEIRDSIANGVAHGFDTDDPLAAIGKRIWRALSYVARELPRLIGDLLGDLTQMIATFVMTLLKTIRNVFNKFFDVIVSGISVLVDSAKVLMKRNMSAAQKGDAIAKIIVGFATTVLGSFVIENLLNTIGLPDPFSDIAAVLLSSIISTVVLYFFNKIDLFSAKRELRLQRIKEVFEARAQKIREDTASLSIMVTEKLKAQRIEFEKNRDGMRSALQCEDFDRVNSEADKFASWLNVDIPYSSTKEFADFVRANKQIKISAAC